MNDKQICFKHSSAIAAPTYEHIVFEVKGLSEDDKPDMQKHLAMYFVGEVVPEQGDKIEMICTRRTDSQIFVNLQVKKQG